MDIISCKHCQSDFPIEEEDRAVFQKLAPVFGGERYNFPTPSLCPECRQQRRLSFRNDQNYYRNECSICKSSLISIYSPDKPYPIVCDTCFWSDEWDPKAFGRDFDFSRPFFEQFAELRFEVPRIAFFRTLSENADFTVHSSRNKNCYMSSSLIDDEDVHYSDFTFRSNDCSDLFSCQKMELCYQCRYSEDCFNSDYLDYCAGLNDSFMCFDCRASHNLVGCVLIRKGSNLILNEPASREEVRETIARLKVDAPFRKEFRKRFNSLKLTLPRQDFWSLNTENSYGDYLINGKNIQYGFNVKNGEDVRHAYENVRVADCQDTTRVGDGEALYECSAIIDLKYSAFCNLTYQCDNLLYSDNCQAGTSSSFGCFSLKREKFCILNKKYSEEEYQQLVPRIIEHMKDTGEWGEFFPTALSPFGYNETKAQDWYPMEQEEVESRGWYWSEFESPMPKGVEVMDPEELPTDISRVADTITKAALRCSESGRPFRIVAPELNFYRKKGLPIPSLSPQIRHRHRTAHQAQRKLWDRFWRKVRD